MIPELEKLSESEIDLLKKIPAMVTILIAGADDEISKSELKEAINLTKIKQSKAKLERNYLVIIKTLHQILKKV